ncbi:ATP-dependent DNA helicase [Legionella dresdenensis]|uniref:ATP-dependent DNA helicase n=1 Tax=Legionella dresdenensis TaxID=450200 RepID=A0ABV8CGT9_9GAMM
MARPPQIELCRAIAKAITDKSTLVAEAGTGTGKTFAYLIPCLLSGQKALISTATKTLQDQLFHKDLPILIRALGLSAKIQNLKGRANYICRHRLELHAEEGRFATPQVVHEVLHIREKIAQLVSGERSELPEISEDSQVWPYVTSTTENCLGSECEYYEECFLVKARKRAMEADLVVINHHLFFADSRLKEEGFGELLPGVEAVIFDEAHQLAEIATNFNGERLGTRQLRELLDDLMREWPVLDLPNQPLKKYSQQAEQICDQLLLSVSEYEDRVNWQQVIRSRRFNENWQLFLELLDKIQTCVVEAELNDNAGVKRCKERLESIKAVALRFNQGEKKMILWLERFKHTLVLHATPFNVSDSFNALLALKDCAYIFTSATLTMADSFECFLKPLGLKQVKTLLLPSPFDYKQQALLYFPRGLPDPKDSRYYDNLLQRVVPVINAFGGRSFFLFTSHRALKQVAQQLAAAIKFPLLVQGEEAKPILLARFRQYGNAVLLGTATFWEGVDVKGEALSCVIIDKLPFASPRDPVMAGKMAYLKEQGISAFDEISLPNAVLALKQGVGRLIRDTADRGVLMIADPRLYGREYGRTILASLPAIKKTRDEQLVLQFINELELEHELISD